jgi:hypothetical protein
LQNANLAISNANLYNKYLSVFDFHFKMPNEYC